MGICSLPKLNHRKKTGMNSLSFGAGSGVVLLLIVIVGYGFFRYLQNNFLQLMIRELPSPLPFDQTVARLTARINEKPGWHVFNTVNQGDEIVQHGGASIGRMTILQFCHGDFASRMFLAETRRRMSVFSPRSISVYEKSDGQTYVAIMNGDLMMHFSPPATRAIIRDVARDVKSMLSFLHQTSSSAINLQSEAEADLRRNNDPSQEKLSA